MIGWPPPPDRLLLENDRVHVWAVELDDETFDTSRGQSFLSPDEQARASRFKFERDRRRYIVAHVALRDILAGYLKAVAADLQFIEVQNGKPKLATPFAAGGIEFNLSHSHERALVAVAQGREVGVDIEFVKPDFSFDEVAERFFTAREVAALRALPVHLQRQAFFKGWTSKEAFLKAKGTGLSGKLDEVEIVLDAAGRLRIDARVPGWSLSELNPGAGYEGAIVTAGNPLSVSGYRWRPVIAP
jgi:4'-phosphopantetheinyl transferase